MDLLDISMDSAVIVLSPVTLDIVHSFVPIPLPDKLFDIQMVFLKEFFQKVNFEKNQQMSKKHEKLPSIQCKE